MENENINSDEVTSKKSRPSFLMTLIIVIVVALIISGITSFFIVRILTSNVSSSSDQSSQVSATTPARVVLIMEGSRYTMMLKGGYDIAVIDSLQLDVGSTQARDLITSNRIEVLEAIRMIFLNKTRGELSTPQGIELTKKQIKDTINEMLGFTGERERLGVVKVTMIIMTITTNQ